MNREIFDKLTEGVSISHDHPDLFIYEGREWRLTCNRCPATDSSYRLKTLSVDENGYSDEERGLMYVDFTGLQRFVITEVELDS